MHVSHPVVQDVFIADGGNFDPQTAAMLQAFYSRSTQSIGDRLDALGDTHDKVRAALKKYYVGYGHRSIGQCANIYLFFENVSMFAAKVIQNNPLYNGQETSTRYYDFSTRPALYPQEFAGYDDLVRDLYSTVLKAAKNRLWAQADDNDLQPTEAAVNARAFDIARGLLPPAFTTKLSWTGSFDNIRSQLVWMLHSPVNELSLLAHKTLLALHEKYPEAIPLSDSVIDRRRQHRESDAFFDDTGMISGANVPVQDAYYNRAGQRNRQPYFTSTWNAGPLKLAESVRNLMETREKYEQLPRTVVPLGHFDFFFSIDYASWRDLQRHRNGYCAFVPPELSAHPRYEADMHPWYVQQMEELGIMGWGLENHHMTVENGLNVLFSRLKSIRDTIFDESEHLGHNGYEAEFLYYVPMGCMVNAYVRYDLQQTVYVAETRAAETVHPTARLVAQQMARAVQEQFPDLKMFVNMTADVGFSNRRGEQTIFHDGKAVKS